ncbi:MAG: hypothetical protein AAF598_17710, partial [Bacteroidota bacterium]
MKLINPTFFRQAVIEQPLNLLTGWNPPSRPVTRRNFLKLVGLSAVVYDPVVNTIGKIVSPGFELQQQKGQVRFLINGECRWEIASHYFDGQPKLNVKANGQQVQIHLTNALFPATNLKADFHCEIQRSEWGWQMDFNSKTLGSGTEIPFVKWLKGKHAFKSSTAIRKEVLTLDQQDRIRLQGKAQTQFDADWTLSLNGHRLVECQIGPNQLADQISFQLNSFRPQSNMQAEDLDRETIIRIVHAEGLSSIHPIQLDGHQKLNIPERCFDELFIEAGRNLEEAAVYTIVQKGSKTWNYLPDTRLNDQHDKALNLALEAPYLVKSHKGANQEFAAFANLSDEPKTLRQGGQFITLHNPNPETPSFELIGNAQAGQLVHFTPTVREVFIPVGNGMTMPMSFGQHKRLFFHEQVNPDLIQEEESLLQVKEENGEWFFNTNDQVYLPLVRKEDFAILGFHFVNFNLNVNTNQLVPVANKSSFVSVYFPPQSFGERAYTYVKPGDPANEAPTSLQIPYFMSGLSRLVFKVPNDQAPIDVTVENLLAWDGWDVSINARAKAPKPNFNFAYEPFIPENLQISPQTQISAQTIEQTSRIRLKPDANARIQNTNPNIRIKPNRGRVKPPKNDRQQATRKPLTTEIRRIDDSALIRATDPKAQKDLKNAVVEMTVPTDMITIIPAYILDYRKPRSLDTFIEAPFRLMVSPSEKHTWLTDTIALDYNDPQTLNQINADAGMSCGQFYEPAYAQALPDLQVFELF